MEQWNESGGDETGESTKAPHARMLYEWLFDESMPMIGRDTEAQGCHGRSIRDEWLEEVKGRRRVPSGVCNIVTSRSARNVLVIWWWT